MPAPDRTRVDERGFPDRRIKIGKLTAVVRHLGVFRDEEPPHQKRDFWDIVIRGPKEGMEYATSVGGSKNDYESRDWLRRKKYWGAGPLGHALYELNWAANDPDDWFEFEVGDLPKGRKAWDPRRGEVDPIQKAKDFMALAAKFDGVIQPANDRWTEHWDEIMAAAVKVR